MSGPSIARAGPDPRLNGVLYPALGDIPSAFRTKFWTRYGRYPDYTAAHAYDAANILVAAVRTGGLNRPRIRDAVQALSPVQGVTGAIEWDAQGQNQGRCRFGSPGPLRDPIDRAIRDAETTAASTSASLLAWTN